MEPLNRSTQTTQSPIQNQEDKQVGKGFERSVTTVAGEKSIPEPSTKSSNSRFVDLLSRLAVKVLAALHLRKPVVVETQPLVLQPDSEPVSEKKPTLSTAKLLTRTEMGQLHNLVDKDKAAFTAINEQILESKASVGQLANKEISENALEIKSGLLKASICLFNRKANAPNPT